MTDAGQWCLIESDPGVFTELIRGFGATGVQVEEVYDLSPEFMDTDRLKPIHGLIFLFKWVQDDYSDGTLLKDELLLSQLFFAKQVINNACATQALINILMNCEHTDLKLGDTLSEFKEFTKTFDSSLKGMSLSNADRIREVHNSFARQQLFEFENRTGKKDEDVFHFIGYIPFKGRLIELDGLKSGPYDLGPISEGRNWVDEVRPHIEKRMQKYSAGEIHFSLLALISDRKMIYQREIDELASKNTEEAKNRIEHLKVLIDDENHKIQKHKIENIRRRHNYLPLIIEILKALGEQGKLSDLYEKSKQKAIELKEKKSGKGKQ